MSSIPSPFQARSERGFLATQTFVSSDDTDKVVEVIDPVLEPQRHVAWVEKQCPAATEKYEQGCAIQSQI